MAGAARPLRYVAFTLMMLFGVVGIAFVVGETFTDPGGWPAVALTAAWAVPMLALIAYALVRKERAAPVFVVVTVLIAILAIVYEIAGTRTRSGMGPVSAISVFALGVALAFLGLYRSLLAGVLLVVLAAVQLAATMLGAAVAGGPDGGRPLGSILGGSSGVIVVPLALIGLLFVAAGLAAHESLRGRNHPRAVRPL